MEEKLSPKVEALYKAVMELLLEGKEVRKMKVSEITERAGIGKGTAYEYFESREELLVRALDYQQSIWTKNIRDELERHDGFMEKIECLFQMIDEIITGVKREAVEEICNIFFLAPMFQKRKGRDLPECLYEVVREARRGGSLKEEFPDEYVVFALSGKILNYVSFCVRAKDKGQRECTQEQIRTYLLNSFRMEFLVRQGEE